MVAQFTQLKHVVVILIKPTQYDDNGFPYRFRRGVLPSNTLAVLRSLVQDALQEIAETDVKLEVHTLDEGVAADARILRKLYHQWRDRDHGEHRHLIVGLVGVQTAQFPRARDLISEWQRTGATCLVGGSHITGSITTMHDGICDAQRPNVPCPKRMPPEIRELMDSGTVVFHGEAEPHADGSFPLADALRDILSGLPKPLYRGGKPDLRNAPLPFCPSRWSQNYMASVGTLDTGRGCPFKCSFCAIINFQGRKMRSRPPEQVIHHVKALCEREGEANFFFTDDNFARHLHWREILAGLASLRQQGYRVHFMIQADLACGKLPGFIEKLAAAGCRQIFFGVESLNSDNLAAVGKSHNKIADYAALWELCHQHGIIVHASYIIGFPHDSPLSVASDIDQLLNLGADQASFYMLGPIPGSEDHVRMLAAGELSDVDLNDFDTFHAITKHPRMTKEEWQNVFRDAWRRFYKPRNMITALKRFSDPRDQRRIVGNFLWYWWAPRVECTHPMIAGMYRYRPYSERRPGSVLLPYWRYLLQECWRHLRYIGWFFTCFYVFQHVVFETKYGSYLAEKQEGFSDRVRGVRDWFRRVFGRAVSRRWLNRFWVRYASNRWQLLNPLRWCWHVKMLPHAVAEVVYTARFVHGFVQVYRSLGRDRFAKQQ